MENEPDELTIEDPLQVDCPFCILGYYVVDAAKDAEPMVLHSMPPCKTFLDNEIDVFLAMARRRFGLDAFD